MDTPHGQLKRILQLALYSPYAGERHKAVSLLLQRLEHHNLRLADLDPSFTQHDTANSLKLRANLPYDFEVMVESHEEAQLYVGLLERYPETASVWLEGHRLKCTATSQARAEIDQLFERILPSLQRRLVGAQQQAMAEYQQTRRRLFDQAVNEEIAQMTQKPNAVER